VSPLYLHLGKLLTRNNKLATSQSCCCLSSSSSSSLPSSSSSSSSSSQCQDCYKVDYVFDVDNCGGSPITHTGSFLINSNGIICYNDPDVFYATYNTLLFNDICSSYINIICNSTITQITLGGFPKDPESVSIPGSVCCGEVLGNHNLSFDNRSISLTISLANTGDCDCSGYNTEVYIEMPSSSSV